MLLLNSLSILTILMGLCYLFCLVSYTQIDFGLSVELARLTR